MPTLAVHEHSDGSYTVTDSRGHVMHSDSPGPIDFNGHGSITAEDTDDPIDLASYALDDWPVEEPAFHVTRKRRRKGRRAGAP